MTNTTYQYIKNRVVGVHGWLIRAGESITGEQFSYAFSKDAPPIGWHLWHMARFADRLQAKMTTAIYPEPGMEIWHRDAVASKWQLEADTLGVFETGMGQTHGDATMTIVQAGQSAVVDYANMVFDVCNATISQLSDSDLEKTYYGLLDYAYDGSTGRVWEGEPKEAVIIEDVIFHANHGSRHMGMMEALRGLLGGAGTLSV